MWAAATVVVLVMSGCAHKSGSTQPAATRREPVGAVVLRRPRDDLVSLARRVGLTPVVGRTVHRACAKAARRTGRRVYCPPVAPKGRTTSDGTTGIVTSTSTSADFRAGFIANFESPSARPSRAGPGHWSIAAGSQAALLVLLRPPAAESYGTVQEIVLDGVAVQVWRMPPFSELHGVYGGHIVIAWKCDGVGYQVSMHGHRNLRRAEVLARALIEEIGACA